MPEPILCVYSYICETLPSLRILFVEVIFLESLKFYSLKIPLGKLFVIDGQKEFQAERSPLGNCTRGRKYLGNDDL